MYKGINPEPNYKKFQRICMDMLERHITYLLKADSKQAIEGKELMTIKIIIRNGYTQGLLIEHEELKSTVTLIYIRISGEFLVGRIYSLMSYNLHPDSAFIFKSFAHEIQHYIDHVRGIYKKEYAMKDKIEGFMKLYPGTWLGSVSTIYIIFCNLYSEGLATFVEGRNAARIIIDLRHISKLLKLLDKISVTDDHEEAEKIYDDRFCPSQFSGEYYLGHLMCCTISLAILSRKNKFQTVSVAYPEHRKIPVFELSQYIKKHKRVELEQFDSATYIEGYQFLTKINHFRKFIRAYDDACTELHISPPVKFLSYEEFDRLKKQAIGYFDRYEEKLAS